MRNVVFLSYITQSLISSLTVSNGPAKLQQTAERERSYVRFPPAVCLLLNVLLKLDPTSRFSPLHLLVLIHQKLIQLYKHLSEHKQTYQSFLNIFLNPVGS